MGRPFPWTPVLALTPYVLMIGGVPFFAGPGRIWILPELAFWFLVWLLLGPCFLIVAERIRVRRAADTATDSATGSAAGSAATIEGGDR